MTGNVYRPHGDSAVGRLLQHGTPARRLPALVDTSSENSARQRNLWVDSAFYSGPMVPFSWLLASDSASGRRRNVGSGGQQMNRRTRRLSTPSVVWADLLSTASASEARLPLQNSFLLTPGLVRRVVNCFDSSAEIAGVFRVKHVFDLNSSICRACGTLHRRRFALSR